MFSPVFWRRDSFPRRYWSVPRLGLRFGSLRPTFMIYDYSINRNIYRCIRALYFTCLDGELRTYREHFASYLRNIIQSMRNVLHVTGRRCYNIPGTSFKVLEEAVTTCQERLASYLQKISQRIRNVLQVTWRRCYNVSGTSCKVLEKIQRIRKVVQVTYK